MTAFIFDVDDTLYDQLEPFKRALTKNFEIEEQDIEKIYVLSRNYSDKVFHLSVSGEMGMNKMHNYRIQNALSDFGIKISKDQADQFQLDYEKYQGEITLLDDVRQVLDYSYDKKILLGVITNGPTEHQWRKIKQLNLEKWIPKEYIIVSGEVGIAKPNSAIFELAEKQMDLIKTKSYYIGDSFENDVVGAKNAGWNAVWCNRRGNKKIEKVITYDHLVDENFSILDFAKLICRNSTLSN